MTLAVVFFAISCTIATPSTLAAKVRPDTESALVNTTQAISVQQDQPSAARQQTSPATANPPAAAPAQTPSSQNHRSAKHHVHKKKPASPNCGVASSPSGSATANPNTASPALDPSTASAPAQNSGNPAPPTNCPPTKVVVPRGGTTEPSIQLAGGPSTDQAAKQREVVNQLLGVTEANLKKIEGQQLSSSQQDTLAQSRAFAKQSKDAAESGDLDRARTLAWKAELLSEDLLKPQK